MNDERPDTSPQMESAFLRGMTQRRMSRRSLMKYAGVGVGGLSLASILAACGGDGGGGTTTDGAAIDWNAAPPVDVIEFANWPQYIDVAHNSEGKVYHPSLDQFAKDTGIDVTYSGQAIQDNASFFGKLQPQLQAGQETGWDIIVITNGREFTALTANEWVIPIGDAPRPNFDKNAATWAKDPAYDPGNKFSMPWQSGITGIGYNKDLTPGTPTTMDDLANPAIVGEKSVGMLKADMPDFVMLNLGIDPQTSGPEEWKEAANWLLMQRESGTIRQYYDQGYLDDLTAGNLAATMAWSGDVLYWNTWGGADNLVFVGPSTDGLKSALLWIDNMMIPQGAKNPQGAMQLMDYVYKPEIAQLITEWVLYMSPVPAVQELIAQHAKEEKDPTTATALEATADNPLLWPDEELLSMVSFGRQLETDDERKEWDDIFLPISES
jgi:spermidine/putrescine transport system substrate-binding protein